MFQGLRNAAVAALMALKGFMIRRPIVSAVLGVLLLLLSLLLWYIFSPVPPEMITETVRRGDLVQRVEAVGAITSDRDVNLKFPMTGIVAKVLIHEGDKVLAGQELAVLRNESYGADLASAAAQYRSALASLRELEEGTRPEDIAIGEADVANKRAALEAVKTDLASAQEKLATSGRKLEAIRREADINLAGYVSTSASASLEELSSAKSALKSLDDIFIDTDVAYMTERFRTTENSIFRARWADADRVIQAAFTAAIPGFTGFETALQGLRNARSAISGVAGTLQDAYDLVAGLSLTSSFTSTVRETYKDSIATQKASVQTSLSTIDATIKSLRDASAGYDTSISTEENTYAAAKAAKQTAESAILTYETSLRTQEAQLALKVAGPRETQLAVARANANAAAAGVARAKARMEDTIIRAPADGVVTKVDFKVGEFTGDPDNANHSITMLGTSPFRVEMLLSEVDIPKVLLSQSGSIELDAFPGTQYALSVTSIEPGPTKVEGVSKYRVTLNFVYPHEEFKIGMTGDAEIITGERKDVLLVPVRSVMQNNGEGPAPRSSSGAQSGGGKIVRILEKGDVIEKVVTTGMESDTDAEILSGLTEGETVIVLIKQ